MPRTSRRGLGLLEVLVATAIMSILMAGFANMVRIMIHTRGAIAAVDRGDWCRARCMNVLAGRGWDQDEFDGCMTTCLSR